MKSLLNRTRPDLWKNDIIMSVRLYNKWFLEAAPEAYRYSRRIIVDDVANLFAATNDMRNITPEIILENPGILATLRMSTAPPLARDRLIGLSGTKDSLVHTLEDGRLPSRMKIEDLNHHLHNICKIIEQLLDKTLFEWLDFAAPPTEFQRELASVVISDRRCGAVADPIVRNAQEARQLAVIEEWLLDRGYQKKHPLGGSRITDMEPGTFSFRQNVPVVNDAGKTINMPVDAVIQPLKLRGNKMPVLVEAKSAGDFTNTNKRRKEEATKARQLRLTYGNEIDLVLFLCGYFDAGYLGYEAAEGLDWVWEHRVEDFKNVGL